MIAAGIDPSLTSTGVGVLVDGKLKHYGRYGRDGHHGESHRTRNNRVRRLRTEVWKAATLAGTPDIVIMEDHPHGVSVSGFEFDRAALWHMIFEAFDARAIPIVIVHPSTHKAWVTGAGQASKLDVIEVIDDWYADQLEKPLAKLRKTVDHPDDLADAIGYATIGAYKLGDPIPFEPKPRHQTSLLLLPWPKIARAR